MTPLSLILDRSTRRLAARVAQLEVRLDEGDETAWPAFLDAVKALALVVANASPERRGALLTTREMAERLQISEKTLLKKKKRGQIRPAVAQGKWLRWKGSEVAR